VVRESKRLLWGSIQAVLEPSPHRLEPTCPHFGRCGGCTWLHFAYPAQAQWKRQIVADCLARIGGLEADVEWAEDPACRLGYRTRAEFHAGEGGVGFYAEGTHRVVDVQRCPLCHDRLNQVLGRLRALPIRSSVQVVVDPGGPDVLVWAKRPAAALKRAFPVVESPHGPATPSHFVFDGCPIVNGAFSQSSLLLNRLLVSTVQSLAQPPGERVLDLYCGNGNLSRSLGAPHVVGLDHNAALVHAANAAAPGDYRVGDETAFAEALQQPWDTVLLDPPRAGAKAILGDLAQCEARQILYVSCDPATLARDLRALTAQGWRLARCVAVDLFPHTAHIESVCRLER